MKEIIKVYLYFKNCTHFDHIFFLSELLPDHYAFRTHDLLSWANKKLSAADSFLSRGGALYPLSLL